MSSLPLHPSIVHVPIALSVLMPLVAIGLLVAWWRDWLPRRAWFVGLVLQAILVGSSFVALQTGETDEERVEEVLASEEPIHAHEEAAEVFFWATIGVLGLFAAGAFLPKESTGRAVATAAAVGTLVVAGLGYRVGHAGGELVYKEGAARAYTAPQGPATQPEYDDHDHDDHDH